MTNQFSRSENEMKKQIYLATVVSASIFLAACEGDDGLNGTNGANGTDGLNSLVATREIPKGDAVCLGGGLALDSGLDTNRNDILDADEVTATELLECAATPTLRALHASPDAPAVNIWVNDAPALVGVDYTQGSGFVPVIEENNIQVEAIFPGDDPLVIDLPAVVIDADLPLDYNTETTVIAVDDVLGPVRPLVITNDTDNRITDGFFRAQVVHAAQGAPEVDVFVTAFGADLTTETPVNGQGTFVAFEDFTGQLEVPEGDYQIRITPDDTPGTVVYDSGEITLGAGADLMIVAVDNTGPGDALVQLVVLDGTAASTLYETNTTASAVAVHLSPDAPAVDILADDNTTTDVEAIALVQNVSFTEFCDIDFVPAPGDYTVNVALNSDNSTIATSFPLNVMKGDEALAIVSGFAGGATPAIAPIALAGNTRSVITETKLRITHASPSTDLVDIYLVADGTDINTVDPDYANVPFGADTTQLSITPGNYDAYVTGAGSKTPAISLTELNWTGGEVLDVIARDPEDGETGPQAVVINYATVPVCPTP
jgi:hypothetical protein